MKLPVYTVGYAKLSGPNILLSLATMLRAVIWDVRAKPMSRRQGFGGKELSLYCNRERHDYEWHGDTLGGLGSDPSPAGIKKLRERTTPVLLLCLEESPGDCHRHTIAMHLGEPVLHIYRDEVVVATDLETAIQNDGEYEFEPLADFLKRIDKTY